MKAYILVQTAVGTCAKATRAIREIAGVKSVEQVTGPYDVVVEVRARNVTHLTDNLVPVLQGVPGVTRTLPCLPSGW